MLSRSRKDVVMERFICKLSSNDPFEKKGYLEVGLWNSKMFRYTLWRKNKRKLLAIPQFFQDEALDLFYISLMVFYVDCQVKRNDSSDRWTRSFMIEMPVLKKAKWDENKQLLEKALDFLTGDHWTFSFRERPYYIDGEADFKKRLWHFRRSRHQNDTDTFCMLSGGLDSFIGAIDLLKDGSKPIFVGNYNGGKGVSVYQSKVIESLASYFSYGRHNFFQFYASPMKSKENTTRSRSFMFFSHAILLASGMGRHVNLCIPENGVISLNIPLTIHRAGSLSTRTTHPYYIGMLQAILDNLGIQVKMFNPFQFKTKGEMIVECKDLDFLKENLKWTMSCSHPDLGRWQGESASNHCGVCLPCTIRRAAVFKARIADDTIYRDINYQNIEASINLKSYRLGLAQHSVPYFAIQKNGSIFDNKEAFADLYLRGRHELSEFLKTIQ